jgi:hypothetical protein
VRDHIERLKTAYEPKHRFVVFGILLHPQLALLEVKYPIYYQDYPIEQKQLMRLKRLMQ